MATIESDKATIAAQQTEPDKAGGSFVAVRNITRNRLIANRVEVAGTNVKRSKGLLGRQGLLPGHGLWIIPCEAIHTFFMRFAIDLVYLDKKMRVKKVRSAVKAWRISACLSAHSVLELPAGTVRETQTERGDLLATSDAEDSDPGGRFVAARKN